MQAPDVTVHQAAPADDRAAQPAQPAAAAVVRQPYQQPRVEALGHWQVHTLESFSIPVLP